MNKLFGENFDSYTEELFKEIIESLDILESESELKEKTNKFYKALKFVEIFFGRKTKLQKRNFTGIHSFVQVYFFLYPLSNLQDLSKKEGDSLSYYQNKIIVEKEEEYKEKYKEIEDKMKKVLKNLPEATIKIT